MPALPVGERDAIAYDDIGRGPLVVLIHGSPGSARAWQPVARQLEPRFRVISPNLPGYGATTRPPPGLPSDSSHAARLIEALLDGLARPAVLAGHSYGGVVALLLALRGHVKPGALVLFEPVAVPVLAAVGDKEGFASARALFDDYRAAFEAGDPLAVRTMIDYWFGSGAFDQMPAAAREYLVNYTSNNVDDVNATFRDAYSVEALRGLAVPTVVVYGDRSPDTMVKIVHAIAKHLPGARLERVDGANHALTTTHADLVAQLIAAAADRSA
jgi:pimeloyl-ACP methyl ester carboxylesterase